MPAPVSLGSAVGVGFAGSGIALLVDSGPLVEAAEFPDGRAGAGLAGGFEVLGATVAVGAASVGVGVPVGAAGVARCEPRLVSDG